MGSFRPGAGNQHLHWYFNFTGCIVETVLKSLRLSCGSELTRTISENVSIPVIASGGAGTKEHFYDAFDQGKADAALAASLFHFKELEIMDLKRYLREKGISVRI